MNEGILSAIVSVGWKCPLPRVNRILRLRAQVSYLNRTGRATVQAHAKDSGFDRVQVETRFDLFGQDGIQGFERQPTWRLAVGRVSLRLSGTQMFGTAGVPSR